MALPSFQCMLIMQADEGSWLGNIWASSLRERLAAWGISMINNVKFDTIVPATLELLTSADVPLMFMFNTLMDVNVAQMPRFKYAIPLT